LENLEKNLTILTLVLIGFGFGIFAISVNADTEIEEIEEIYTVEATVTLDMSKQVTRSIHADVYSNNGWKTLIILNLSKQSQIIHIPWPNELNEIIFTTRIVVDKKVHEHKHHMVRRLVDGTIPDFNLSIVTDKRVFGTNMTDTIVVYNGIENLVEYDKSECDTYEYLRNLPLQ
jgi:hypothetical protein